MQRRHILLIGALGLMASLTYTAMAQERTLATNETKASAQGHAADATKVTHTENLTNAADERAMRLGGEKRFRTNCGRCHQPPHKFPPRVMAAAIRHMRVRAMITDEDMRLILRYMTE